MRRHVQLLHKALQVHPQRKTLPTANWNLLRKLSDFAGNRYNAVDERNNGGNGELLQAADEAQ
jgi:hypothetical protein